MEWLNNNLLGTIGILISVAFGLDQLRINVKLKAKQQTEVWEQISAYKGLLRSIEKSDCSDGGREQRNINISEVENSIKDSQSRLKDYTAIISAEILICKEFRRLLATAISMEKNFSLKTIVSWRKVGKLSSDWQERQALQILSSKACMQVEIYKDLITKSASSADETGV